MPLAARHSESLSHSDKLAYSNGCYDNSDYSE